MSDNAPAPNPIAVDASRVGESRISSKSIQSVQSKSVTPPSVKFASTLFEIVSPFCRLISVVTPVLEILRAVVAAPAIVVAPVLPTVNTVVQDADAVNMSFAAAPC